MTVATAAPTLKFFWNGIKANGGKLQKAHFTKGNFTPEAMAKYGFDNDTITVYNRSYIRFTQEIREVFTVVNESDMVTDYFETDRIRVKKDHPLYAQVLKAFYAQEEHNQKIRERRILSR
jgi:hypothetical protein